MTGEEGGGENCHPLITSLLNEGAVIKMGSRSNPRDENVQVPARRSREEIRQEVDLERRKEEMKKEVKMKAESEAFYLKLPIQA